MIMGGSSSCRQADPHALGQHPKLEHGTLAQAVDAGDQGHAENRTSGSKMHTSRACTAADASYLKTLRRSRDTSGLRPAVARQSRASGGTPRSSGR
jgi:hypothetical protein